MRKIILGLSVLLGLASCQEQQKIAFIDNSDVIDEYQMKIDIEKKYEKKNKTFTQRRDSIGRVYQGEIQSVQMRLASLSQQKQQEESQAFQQKWQPIQQQIQYEQQQMEQQFSEEMESVITAVSDFVESYGESNGYTFILGKNQAGSVMYGNEINDISEQVIKAINKAYKAKDSETEDSKKEDNTETED